MNEYSGLSEGQLKLAMDDAEDRNDWAAMSKIQVAEQAESFGGMAVKFQPDFIDRR